jgi:hypothetical protein
MAVIGIIDRSNAGAKGPEDVVRVVVAIPIATDAMGWRVAAMAPRAWPTPLQRAPLFILKPTTRVIVRATVASRTTRCHKEILNLPGG